MSQTLTVVTSDSPDVILVVESGPVGPTGATGPARTTTTGTGAPSSTPSTIGDIFIDTAGPGVYIATGTSSAADWAALLSS